MGVASLRRTLMNLVSRYYHTNWIVVYIDFILATQPDVDGFLVGGASLKPEFVDIINAKKAQ